MKKAFKDFKKRNESLEEQAREIGATLDQLEEQAGILNAAQAIRENLNSVSSFADEPEMWGSKSYHREIEEELKHRREVNQAINKLYWSVGDAELQYKLLKKNYELKKNRFVQAQESWQFAGRVYGREKRSETWVLIAIAFAIVFVALGNYWFGTPGIVIGALISLFWGRQSEKLADKSLNHATILYNVSDGEFQFTRKELDLNRRLISEHELSNNEELVF